MAVATENFQVASDRQPFARVVLVTAAGAPRRRYHHSRSVQRLEARRRELESVTQSASLAAAIAAEATAAVAGFAAEKATGDCLHLAGLAVRQG